MTLALPLHKKSIRFRARSFVAFALAPEAPVAEWLERLDGWTENSPGFFAGRPVVLDLNMLKPAASEVKALVSELADRGIRVYAIEGSNGDELGPDLPPLAHRGQAGDGRGPAREARCRMKSLRRPGRCRGAAGVELADHQVADPLRPVGLSTAGRRDRARLGRLRLRDHRRRIRPRLRHACADASSPAPRETPTRASSAAGTRPSFWPWTAGIAPPTTWSRRRAASRYRPFSRTASSASRHSTRQIGRQEYGQGSGRHIRQGRRRQDDVDGGSWGSACPEPASWSC